MHGKVRSIAAVAAAAMVAGLTVLAASAVGAPPTMQQTAASAVNYAAGHGYHAVRGPGPAPGRTPPRAMPTRGTRPNRW